MTTANGTRGDGTIVTKLGRRGALRGAALFAALCVATVALGADALAPTPANPTAGAAFLRSRSFRVPFLVDAADPEAAAEVLLFVSDDRGAKWKLAAREIPTGSEFAFTAPSDGEYWFSTRTLDAQGKWHPSGPHRPEMRAIVDTQPPTLKIDAWITDPAELHLICEANDANVDAEKLAIYWRAPEDEAWRPVTIEPRRRQITQTSVRVQADVQLSTDAEFVYVHVLAADQAGNRGSQRGQAPRLVTPAKRPAPTPPPPAPPPRAALVRPYVPTTEQDDSWREPPADDEPTPRPIEPALPPRTSRAPAPPRVERTPKIVPVASLEEDDGRPLSVEPPAPDFEPELFEPIPDRAVPRMGVRSSDGPTIGEPVVVTQNTPPRTNAARTPSKPPARPETGGLQPEDLTAEPLPAATLPEPTGPTLPSPEVLLPSEEPAMAAPQEALPRLEPVVPKLPAPRASTPTPVRSTPMPAAPAPNATARPKSPAWRTTPTPNEPAGVPTPAPIPATPTQAAPVLASPTPVRGPNGAPAPLSPMEAGPLLSAPPAAPPASRLGAPREEMIEPAPIEVVERFQPGAGGGASPSPGGPTTPGSGATSPGGSAPGGGTTGPGAGSTTSPGAGSGATSPGGASPNRNQPRENAPPGGATRPGRGAEPIGPNVPGTITPGTPAPGTNVAPPTTAPGGNVPPAAPGGNNPLDTLPPPRPGEANLDYDILLRAARNALAIGNLEESLRRYEILLERFPDDLVSRSEYAGVLVQAKKLREASEQFQLLIERSPDDDRYIVAMADVLFQMEEYKAAIDVLRAQEARGPLSPAAAGKLALALAFNDEEEAAVEVYDKYLSKLDLEDPDIQSAIAPVLLQLRRAEDALPLLRSLREKKPGDLFAYINLAQAHVQLAQYNEAVEVVRAMKDVQPENVQDRLEMGERLVAPEARNVAVAVFQQILERDPQNREAKVAMAEVYLTTFEPQLAWPLLVESFSDKPYQPHTMAVAEYHLLTGEYADALLVYRSLAQQYSDDPDVFIAMGDLFHAISVTEMDTARLQYNKALSLDPKNRLAKIKLARNYAAQRYYHESNEICRELIAANPHETEAYQLLGENLIRMGEVVEVEQLIEARKLLGTRDRIELGELRNATGRLLFLLGKPLDAMHEFQAAAGIPGGMKAVTAYGLYASLMALDNPPKAQTTLLTSIAVAGPQTYVRMIVGNLALQDCDYKLAAQMFGEVYKYTPNNVRAGVRLGISLAGARLDPTREDAIGAFQSVLAQSPSNFQSRLELARLLNAETSYPASVKEYDMLINTMPGVSVAWREKARVLTSWKGFDGSCYAYDQAVKMASKGETVPPVATPGADGVPAPSAIPEIEVSGTQAEIIATEAQGKATKGWRPFYSTQAFEGLTEMEPYEGDGFFELAQGYSGLNQTHDAMEVYKELLSLNPCHREACIALRRAYLETRPQSRNEAWYFTQQGRDGLADISRLRLSTLGVVPYGDEDEYVAAGYGAQYLITRRGPDTRGDIFTLATQGKWGAQLHWFGRMDVESYLSQVSTRPTGEFGFRWSTLENINFTFAPFLENVFENRESIAQDIYRGGGRVELDTFITRRWWFDTRYRFIGYSDENFAHDFYVHNAFWLTLPPRQLRLLVNYDLFSYAEQTIFGPGGDVIDSIHPYFSPSGYSQVSAILEWKHWLTADFFKGADEFYYMIQFGSMFDSSGQYFSIFNARIHRDYCRWLSAGASTGFQASPVYDSASAMAYFTIRFP